MLCRWSMTDLQTLSSSGPWWILISCYNCISLRQRATDKIFFYFFFPSTAKITMSHLGVFVCPKFEAITAFYVRTCMSLHIFRLFVCMFYVSASSIFPRLIQKKKKKASWVAVSPLPALLISTFFSPAHVHILNKMRLFHVARMCACLRDNCDWQVTLRGILSCWERKRRQRERQPAENCRENLPTHNYAAPRLLLLFLKN